MNCPRCKLALRRDTYEGVEVDYCPECWGYWLDQGELEIIAKRQKLAFSEQERKTVAQALGGRVADPPQALPAPCPHCQTPMTRVAFSGEAPAASIMIDHCQSHGVWLDTGELKALQIFAEGRSPAQRQAAG